ncbi:MAG: hypothetical protein ACOVN4_04335 [Bosea sp. (in: a-proteobacteria)]|jgi:hypothetical protein
MKRPQLIPDWRRAWRWWSVQASALIVVWVAMPPDAQAALVALFGVPAEKVPGILAALGVVGRMLQQPARKGDDQ